MTAPVPPPAAPGAGVSPFEPAGVVFTPVSPRLITARLLGAEGANAVGAILGVALGVAVSPWLHLLAALGQDLAQPLGLADRQAVDGGVRGGGGGVELDLRNA